MPLFGNTYVCGIYYIGPGGAPRQYLPRVKLDSHTTLNPVSFTTTLQQTYHNPNKETINEARYAFPLYDGVAVNSYTISFADKQLTGIVKQKDDAKQTYQEAVDRGESAGLLESLPAGVFGVTLGNVPPGVDIFVNIQYCGELRHDAGIDGLRYTLPTSIAPRYGNVPDEIRASDSASKDGIKITIDADMAKYPIRKVQSPSHPIAVSMGATSSQAQDAAFSASRASATLALGATALAQDFVLQLVVDNIAQPQAILENHSTLPNHRAIMASLVPKFSLEPAHPEIVFIADQSGSMQGEKNDALVSALKIFLKSLPLGVRFNIVPFGSHFKPLWPTSQAYNETNFKQALAFVDTFHAHYGGTEILQPIQAAFKNRLKDLPLEVMLLTDGEIWGEHELFSFINSQLRGTEKVGPVDARVFALGIGGDVSHTLVEGAARAGNGFAQFVADGENADAKVMRMLKGALYAHTKDYTVEINYVSGTDGQTNGEDDFELVEHVKDSLSITEKPVGSSKSSSPVAKKSFFDETADLDKPVDKAKDRYAHLPTIDRPKALQAPADLPPLYPYNRTTAYFLLGPAACQKPISSITIRAKSSEGPLELTIPVHDIGSGATVHQLAARKAIQDLEEGRGWLENARSKGLLLKEKYKTRFDEIVEREAVHLGVQFQVASKWTSFVAVENAKESQQITRDGDERYSAAKPGVARARKSATPSMFSRSAAPAGMAAPRCSAPPPAPMSASRGGGLFGKISGGGGSLFGSAAPAAVPPPPSGGSLFGGASRDARSFKASARSTSAWGNASSSFGGPAPSQPHLSEVSFMGHSANPISNPYADSSVDEDESMAFDRTSDGVSITKDDMNRLIDLQTFFGAWELNDGLKSLLQLSDEKVLTYKSYLARNWPELDGAKAASNAITATIIALVWLEKHYKEKKEVWEMVAAKGRNWVNGALNNDRVDDALAEASGIM